MTRNLLPGRRTSKGKRSLLSQEPLGAASSPVLSFSNVIFDDEFDQNFQRLSEEDQDEVAAATRKLTGFLEKNFVYVSSGNFEHENIAIKWYILDSILHIGSFEFIIEDLLTGARPPNQGDTLTRGRTSEFKRQASPPLSVPKDGKAKLYLGKRIAGDVRAYLIASYPYREDAEPLTLSWLEKHDRSAYRALYTQSTEETGTPAEFLARHAISGDELLKRHSLDLDTPEGIAEARRVYGLLSGRLHPRRRDL